MAVIFPQGVEVFSNVGSCVATSTFGTTNPGAGGIETWTVGTGSTSFPVANFGTGTFTGVSNTPPGNFFYVTDPADTTHEIILVIDNNSSGSPGTSWKVQRGMNGATVAHSSGATYVQVISPFTLQNVMQKPGAYVGASSITVAGSTETILASYTPVSAGLVAGAAWYGVAFGVMGPAISTTAGNRILTVRVMWGGSGSVGGTYTTTGSVQLATLTTGTNCPAIGTTVVSGGSFDINFDVSLFSTTQANANINMFYTTSTNSLTAAQSTVTLTNTASSTPWGSTASPITISGATSNVIFLTAHWGGAVTNGLVTVAPYIRAEA